MNKVYTPEEAIAFIKAEFERTNTKDDSTNYTSIEGIKVQIEAMKTPAGLVFYGIQVYSGLSIRSLSVVKEVVSDFGIVDRLTWLEQNSDQSQWSDLFDHFMSSPVAVTSGVAIAARSRTVYNRSELEKYIKEHTDAGETCYLYKILSLPVKEDAFAAPVSRWAVRYGVV